LPVLSIRIRSVELFCIKVIGTALKVANPKPTVDVEYNARGASAAFILNPPRYEYPSTYNAHG
jgi:hypothetical protein